MSKNNLNSEVKVTQTVEAPKTVTPNVFKLRPLKIEQPIEIVQSVNIIGPEQPEEPAPAPVAAPAEAPVKKAKCRVRRAQKVWFVITLLLAIAVVAAYMFVPAFYDLFVSLKDSNANNEYANWTVVNHGLTAGIVLAVAFVATVLVRFICHPIGCKVRKGKTCCFRCETLKFFWTILLFSLGVAALFGYLKLFSINKALAGALAFNNLYGLVFLGVAAATFVVLVIATIAHRAKDKRQAKLAAKEEAENAAYKAQAPHAYNPNATGVYEDINSPHNAYRNNKTAKARKGSKVGKFFIFLLVLVALVVAYAVVAYFVPQVPGSEFVRGLINR